MPFFIKRYSIRLIMPHRNMGVGLAAGAAQPGEAEHHQAHQQAAQPAQVGDSQPR